MGDFIVETIPLCLQLPAGEAPTGFVAEVRPSSRRHAVIGSPRNVSDSLNFKSFDYFKQNTQDNLETDVKCLLQNKSFSHGQMTNLLQSSIVKLINTFLTGYSVTEIHGSIQVALAESKQMISVNLSEDYDPVDRRCESHLVPCINEGLSFKRHNVKNIPDDFPKDLPFQGEFNKPIEHPYVYQSNNSMPFRTEMLQESHRHLETPGIDVDNGAISDVPQSYRRISQCSDKSDEESGYSSTELESVSSSPKRASVGSLDSPDILNIEDEEAGHLVIDLSKPSVSDKIEPSFEIQKLSRLEVAVEYDEYIDFDHQRTACNVQDTPDERTPTIIEKEDAQNQETATQAAKVTPMDLSGEGIKGETHVQTESERKTEALISCKKCPEKLVDPSAYGKHMLECHKLHSCSTCFKDFSSKNNLKRHVRIHTGSRPYKCVQCDMSFARKDDLKAHMLKHNFNKPFRCSLCKKGYTDRACVKNHMSKEHCSRLMKICPQCGESFDREDAFLLHKQTHPALKQFACDTCPFIGTNHLMAMKHTLLHSHKLFSCKPCNAYFADPFDYTKHVRKHKKNTDYSFYVCCFCNCTLPTYEQFVRHEYSHAQGKLHECSVCKKQFKSKASMLEHALVHSTPRTPGDQPSTQSNTNTHIEEATADRVEGMPIYSSSTPTPKTTTANPSQAVETVKTLNQNTFISPIESRSDESTPMRETPITMNAPEGELLDLSMKPPKADSKNSSAEEQNMVTDQTDQTAMAGIPSLQTSIVSTQCVPRNGCASTDTHVAVQGKPSHGICSVDHQTSSSPKDEEFQVVWQSPTFPLMDGKKIEAAPEAENVPKSKAAKPLSFLPRQMSPNRHVDGHKIVSSNNVNNRFKPYSQMMNFASKFIAARGNSLPQSLLKDIGNTSSGLLLKARNVPAVPKQGDASHVKTCFRMGTRSNVFTPGHIKEEHANAKDAAITSPSHMMLGLTGKPCSTPTVKLSPMLKQEVVDSTLHRQSPIYPPKPSTIPQNASPRSLIQVSNISTDISVSNVTTNNNSDSESARECDICKTSFESFSQLESHSVVNHNRYMCEFCGKGFTARPNRDRHVRYHTGERPYKCELCDSKFFRGDDLKYHRTTRHPMEQINCNRCTASFTWQKDLERHLRHSKCVITV